MTTSEAARTADEMKAPPAPTKLEQLGIGVDHIEHLLIKTLYTGEDTGQNVADRLRLPFALIEPLIERARAEHLVEVRGADGVMATGYRYALTDLGRDRGSRYLDVSAYIGPVPVALAVYVDAMRRAAEARPRINRERLKQAFSSFVIDDALFDQVGPAVNARKAMFVHGAPGNGKTVLGRGLGAAIGGEIYMPHAISVDGHIITMFDPITHEPVETTSQVTSILAAAAHDRRWVRIRRPIIVVGGELTLDMLDLTFNPIAKFYDAPIQLKANGGVLLVDDFGRQRMRPADLLNRWIVPLENQIDYLTLDTGRKFQVPFDVQLAFATNLDPAALVDEAFLRRIPYKIEVLDPTLDQFTRIFELNCERLNLRFHHQMVAYVYQRYYAPASRPLRACHPRDLLDQLVAICEYRGDEPAISPDLLDAVCTAYFLDAKDLANDWDPGRMPSEEVRQ